MASSSSEIALIPIAPRTSYPAFSSRQGAGRVGLAPPCTRLVFTHLHTTLPYSKSHCRCAYSSYLSPILDRLEHLPTPLESHLLLKKLTHTEGTSTNPASALADQKLARCSIPNHIDRHSLHIVLRETHPRSLRSAIHTILGHDRRAIAPVRQPNGNFSPQLQAITAESSNQSS